MKEKMNKERLAELLQENFPRERSFLLPVLHFIHKEFGFLEESALEEAAKHLRVPVSEVWGSATSYTELRTREPSGNVVGICTGLSCVLKGAHNLLSRANKLAQASGIDNTTIEELQCGFLCGVAPVLRHNHKWTAHAVEQDVINAMEGGTHP